MLIQLKDNLWVDPTRVTNILHQEGQIILSRIAEERVQWSCTKTEAGNIVDKVNKACAEFEGTLGQDFVKVGETEYIPIDNISEIMEIESGLIQVTTYSHDIFRLQMTLEQFLNIIAPKPRFETIATAPRRIKG